MMHHNYEIVRKDRQILATGGGVCILIDASTEFSRTTIDEKYISIEIIAIDVIINPTTQYRVACFYRPPDSNLIYLNLLCECITNLCDSPWPTILVGDLNLPDISWDFNTVPVERHCNTFVTCCFENSLTQLVHVPTRKNNILDVVLTNTPTNISALEVQSPFSTSDHSSVVFNIQTPTNHLPAPLKNQNIYKYNFRRADYASIGIVLDQTNWETFFADLNDIDLAWNSFHKLLTDLVLHHVPLRNTKNQKPKPHPKHIRIIEYKKHQAWKMYSLDRTKDNLQSYETMAKKYKDAIAQLHRKNEMEVITSNDTRKLYAYVNSKLTCRTKIPPLKNKKGTLEFEDSKKAEILNDQFRSVFTTDDGANPIVTTNDNTYLKEIQLTELTVSLALQNLSSSYAICPDGLPTVFYKELRMSLCKPLTKLFQMSFTQSKIPRAWKIANVSPIPKKGASSSASDYRPISLTCTPCRIMEFIIRNQLTSFLDSLSVINANQHGFVRSKSTVTQLLECLNDWTSAIEQRQLVDIIYLDFAKAFDTVCHRKLLTKLKAIGIDGKLLSWLESFLSDRSQVVIVNNTYSSPAAVISGVPQGSVLGPTLFLIYINDIQNNLPPGIRIKLFADDCKLYIIFTTDQATDQTNNLNLALDRILSWTKNWQLDLSLPKSAVLHLGTDNPQTPYYIGHYQLSAIKSIRDLGIIVDQNLSFAEHCSTITKKALQRANLILRAFQCRDKAVLIRAYCTYVRPLLEYASPVWSPHIIQNIDQIEKGQSYFTSTRATRETRTVIGERSGRLAATSVISPAFPPQMASSNCVARSSAARVAAKSTPRSKRKEASVARPKRRARPAIASG